MVEMNLADAVEIEFGCGPKGFDDVRALPSRIAEAPSKEGLAIAEVVGAKRVTLPHNEKEPGAAVAQAVAGDLLPRNAVAYIDVVVMPGIVLGVERRHDEAEIPFELTVIAERDRPHLRMQTVGADHKVERPRRRVLERDIHGMGLHSQGDDGIAKDRFHPGGHGVIEQLGELAARNADKAVVQILAEDIRVETADPPAPRIDYAHLLDRVAPLPDLRDQTHPLRDIISGSPEVDHVAALAQARRSLDQGRLEPVP